MIFFECTGLNFNKFLKELKLNNIDVYNLKRNSYKEFEIAVSKKDCNHFLLLAKKNNIKVKQQNKTFLSKVVFGIKNNLAVFLCFVICVFGFCFFSNFVYRVEIAGLKNISNSQVLEVLNQNKIFLGKAKWEYDFDNIELVIKNNIENVSLVSVAVLGNTMVINIHEKID